MYSISQVKIITEGNTFFSGISNHERVCALSRQRLYKHFNNESFFSRLIVAKHTNTRLAYPIPKILYPIFHGENIELSKVCSFLMFLTYCKFAIFGLARVALNSKIYSASASAKSGIYLNNVTPSFTRLDSRANSYLKWIIGSQNHHDQTVFHDSAGSDKGSNLHYYPLQKCGCATYVEMFKSQISGIRWIYFSLYKVFLGDISYIVLLDDIVSFKRICNAVNAQGIKSAYFHTTDYCSRPLWTLSHEINCDIKFVFYSTNVEIFQPESYLSNKTFNGWQLSVWDHVLAWSENNRDFI
ncbi:hypothetical protein OAO59_04370, partial [Gammaproteobacteria bacterium]|nr:hypothetical protein [Gammaproteobacteria bacterium]